MVYTDIRKLGIFHGRGKIAGRDVTAKGVVEVDEELEPPPPPGARGLTPLGVSTSYP